MGYGNEGGFLNSLEKVRPGLILAAVIVAGYVIGIIANSIQIVCVTPGTCYSALEFLVQQNGLVTQYHAYFELFTSIFVTNSDADAVFNAIAVIVIDYFLPEPFNNTRYFAIFFASALLGNVLTLAQGPGYASAGASGGIFGILAAAFSYVWVEEKKIDRVTLALFLIIFLGSSFLISQVNWVAHVGGAIGGFICGPLLYFSLKKQLSNYGEINRSSQRNKLILYLVIALLTVGSTIQFLYFVI